MLPRRPFGASLPHSWWYGLLATVIRLSTSGPYLGGHFPKWSDGAGLSSAPRPNSFDSSSLEPTAF
jgi:hypothetical protein